MQNLAFLKSRIIQIACRTLDMGFPITCPDCGIAVDSTVNPGIFCNRCRENLWNSCSAVVCERCGASVSSGALLLREGCYCCDRNDGRLSGIVTLAAYHDDARLRSMILAMKHGGKTWYSREFGYQLARKIQEDYSQKTWDAVVAVPLHRSRMWKRGYNQAALIAGFMATRLGVPAYRWLLTRSRKTSPQSGGRSDRKQNVQGAFSSGGICRNARIILVDDVITTGSTAVECASILHKAGAAEILAAACAWVPVQKRRCRLEDNE